MKFRMHVEIEVPVADWCEVYGVEAEDVLDDVRSWVLNTLNGAQAEGLVEASLIHP